MVTKYSDFLKIYEFHPGSEDPYTTILNRINKAISLGADYYILKSMIKEILNFYNGQENVQKFNRTSDEFKYITLISDAIDTSLDDGYDEDMITRDLERVYNEMK